MSKPVSKVVFLQDCPVRELGSGRKFSVKVNVNPYLPGQGKKSELVCFEAVNVKSILYKNLNKIIFYLRIF